MLVGANPSITPGTPFCLGGHSARSDQLAAGWPADGSLLTLGQ
jgi:hypothetical protein